MPIHDFNAKTLENRFPEIVLKNLAHPEKWLACLFVVLMLCMPGGAGADASDALVLDVQTQGIDLTLSWTAVPGATSYMLYFALPDYKGDLDPATIGAVDLGNITTISAPLWNGADFYIAVASMHGTEIGMISTIEQVTIFTGEIVFPETGTVWTKILDPDGRGTIEFVGTDNNGKPGLPLTEVRMPSDDGEFTLKLDARGRVQSVSRGPVGLSFTFQSDDSVNFEYRFDGELVVSDTTASLQGLTNSLTKSLDICTQYTTREAYEKAVKESPEIVELKKDISTLAYFFNVFGYSFFRNFTLLIDKPDLLKLDILVFGKIRDNLRYLAWVIAQTQANKMAEWDRLCADQPNDDVPPPCNLADTRYAFRAEWKNDKYDSESTTSFSCSLKADGTAIASSYDCKWQMRGGTFELECKSSLYSYHIIYTGYDVLESDCSTFSGTMQRIDASYIHGTFEATRTD